MKPKFRTLLTFTGAALTALSSASAQTTYTGASGTAGATDTWNIAARWDAGVPSGAIDAIIGSSKFVVVNTTTPTYSGSLSIGSGSTLQIGWSGAVATAYNALGNGNVTMAAGSTLTTRNAGTMGITSLTLTGNATINLGNSTQVPAVLNLGGVTGAHTLTLSSNGQGTSPLATLSALNGFSALVIQDIGGRGNPADTFRANAAGSLGTGNVTVAGVSALARSPVLRISASNAMADSGTLFLNGLGASGTGADRLVMDNGITDSIGGLFLSGVKQISGVYTRAGRGSAFMGTGTGTLTVGGSTAAYWDLNDTSAGSGSASPSGTWDASGNTWNAIEGGTGTAGAWVAGQTAWFSAGTDATGSYAINVSGTQDVGGIGFDRGTVAFSGDAIRLMADTPIFVASGASASFANTITQDVAGRGLHKSGAGTLTLSGTGNSYSGGTFIGAGTLNADSANALGSGAVTLTAGNLNLNAAQSISSVVVNAGTLRLAHANAVASATAIDVNAGALTLQLRGDTATTFAGAPVNFNPTANTQAFTINVDNNGSGTNNQLVLNGGFNRRVNVNQNTAANGMTLNVTGANGYSLSIPTMNLSGGMSTTLNPTTANLSITTLNATTGTTAFGGANNIVLTLGGGASSVNSIGSITETSNANQQLVISKGTAATWILGNVDTKQGNGHAMSAGTLTLNGTFKFSHSTDRRFTLSGGVLNYNNAAAIQTNTGTTSGNGFVITGGSLDNTSGAAITTSTHNPRMTWGGNWTFIGTNGADSNLNLGTGAVFLTGTRQVSVTNAATTLTVGGIISGTGFGVTKAGAGKLVLGGINSYTGATDVNAGTLEIALNGSTAAASAVTVSNSGSALVVNGTVNGTLLANVSTSLSGTGTVNGVATVNGAHNPGNSPGIQTFTAGLSYGSTATLNVEFVGDTLSLRGTDYDGVNVTGGNLVIDSLATLALFTSGIDYTNALWDSDRDFTIIDFSGAGTSTGSFVLNTASAGSFGSEGSWSLANSSNDIVLSWTPVPEPNAAALLGALGTLLLLRRRR